MESKQLTVCITGAAGQIGYSLIPLVCSGLVFGPSTKIDLRLLDIEPCIGILQGVELEILDGAYPLVKNIKIGFNPEEIFKDINVGIFVGGFPRKPGMERKELLSINGKIFKAQGTALDKVADKNCKVLVVANPANTNCLLLQANCPSIPAENFTCLTRLDQNRAISQLR